MCQFLSSQTGVVFGQEKQFEVVDCKCMADRASHLGCWRQKCSFRRFSQVKLGRKLLSAPGTWTIWGTDLTLPLKLFAGVEQGYRLKFSHAFWSCSLG